MLRKYNCFRIHIPDCLTELLPEIMIILRTVSKVCSHIQTPAINVIGKRSPFSCNMHHIVKQLL